MLAMQYEIALPADYDMGIIRHRVATRGSGTDAWPGLALKAYLVRERGVDGASGNAYAPFYLWSATEGMNDFLWGAGFPAILGDFGRPTVQQWIGLGFHRGPEFGAAPVVAHKQLRTIGPDTPPAAEIASALAEAEARAQQPGTHSVAVAIDTVSWQLVRLSLLTEPAEDARVQQYQVLHLSAPGAAKLTVGRQWP